MTKTTTITDQMKADFKKSLKQYRKNKLIDIIVHMGVELTITKSKVLQLQSQTEQTEEKSND